MPNFTIRKNISQAASVFVICVGCVVLIGWIFDIALFKSVLPELVTMKAYTAIAFLVCAVSLWLLSSPTSQMKEITSSSLLLLIFQGCAIAVTTLGLLTLCQYLFGWNLGIDELLFRDSPQAIETSNPGRMGVNTTVNFLRSGLALWLLGQKSHRSYWLAQGLSLIVALISLQAFIGYAYGVKIFISSAFTLPLWRYTQPWGLECCV